MSDSVEAVPETEMSAGTPRATEFVMVRRGYDPRQVDSRVESLGSQAEELNAARRREHARATQLEHQLQAVQARLREVQATGASGEAVQQGFGYRVEKLLLTVEEEAGQVRASAAREATALLERARADAERHRHEVEQSLISRTSALDQQAAQRGVALDERERQIAELSDTARDEASRVFAEARREVEQLRIQARTRIDQERIASEDSIRTRREAAEEELARLQHLYEDARAQLAKLLERVSGEFRSSSKATEDAPNP